MDQYCGDDWFLDSGSLLGIIRDHSFLVSDLGIDLSIIVPSYSHKPIKELAKSIENLGFILSRYEWNGVAYKYCFAPSPSTGFKFAIDLHLFVRVGNEYLCPQVSLNKNKGIGIQKVDVFFRNIRKGNIISCGETIYDKFKSFVAAFYRYKLHYFGHAMNMSKYVSKNCGDTFFWVIPVDLYNGTKFSDDVNLRVLKHPDSYLEYRYGVWRIPNSDWNTIRDDGGIRKTNCDMIDCMINR